MNQSPGILLTLFSFLLVIGPLIFLHELGHYWAGRLFGVKADAFSIGFGREVVGWTDRRGTRWMVGWIPLGGYVKFAGDMNPASTPTAEWLALPPEERSITFQAKPLWQRFIIVAAGPVTNFVVAVAIFIGFFIAFGQPRTPPVVAAIVQNSAAAAAGLRVGDRITAIGGRSVETFDDIVDIVIIRPDESLAVDFRRDGKALRTMVHTKADIERDRFGNEFRRGMIGVASGERVIVPLRPDQAIGAAVGQTFSVVRMMVDTLGQIVTGRRSVKDLGGPLKIAQVSGQQATLGGLNVLLFMAMISINLGFINLLPIPLLDGGHLFFYVIEGLRRRPLPEVAQEWAFRSGLALLLAFMVMVTVNDVVSLGIWKRLAGLIG